ncbi:MAG: nucleotide kinase domain-containing protein [Terriglobia bacterium]
MKRRPPTASIVFDTYWRFAVERQEILFRRVRGQAAPWTRDPILSQYKFTNAYRAVDRVSQYLIRSVIYAGSYDARDAVFRVLLFKLFNKIETWQLLERTHGELRIGSFDVSGFDRTLTAATDAGASIYSGAYIMPSGPASIRQSKKHRMHLELLATLMRENFTERLLAARSMEEGYKLLLAIPGIGPFLAYQFVTDLNYSNHLNFSEMEFVVPGPGARDGMKKCFTDLGDYSESDAIKWVAERQAEEFAARSLVFPSLWGRPLQLIDCQNLFCEVDKYSRVRHPEVSGYSGRTRIKQKFSANPALFRPWFPPKWKINDRVGAVEPPVRTDLLAD